MVKGINFITLGFYLPTFAGILKYSLAKCGVLRIPLARLDSPRGADRLFASQELVRRDPTFTVLIKESVLVVSQMAIWK